ncbi:MAG TPA: hypothetical protein PLH19_14400 [Anaerolineae bacterium]|nr:hypothetical protein [Anaerolineae bacterium]HQH39708.1 hypothetical protein [Anaerolineae bacterium]
MRNHDRTEERVAFQEAAPYLPQIDSRADVAIVYGLDPGFEERFARWKEAGYFPIPSPQSPSTFTVNAHLHSGLRPKGDHCVNG